MSTEIIMLILKYGYLVVFVGALTEGELVVIAAGMMAFAGHLNLFYVIFWATVGTALSEYISYIIGYKYGNGFLYRLTDVKYINYFVDKSKIDMMLHLIHINQYIFIICFRFMLGIRTFGPILIGTSQIKPKLFIICNLIGAFLWSAIFAGIGYIANYATLTLGLPDISKWIMMGIILLINLTIIPTMIMKLFKILNQQENIENAVEQNTLEA